MEPTDLAAEFIAFCLSRRPARWPEIYDEMCWVAGRRLFHGLGYVELSHAGLVLDLTHMDHLRRLVEQVAARGGTR
jgi:hypothetical protein